MKLAKCDVYKSVHHLQYNFNQNFERKREN
jgi:hypothetical protein